MCGMRGLAGQCSWTYSDAATCVDIYGPSAGFTACDTPVLRWTEPLVPMHAAAPVHPDLTGMTAVKHILVSHLSA